MKELVFRLWDDLARADGEKVEADATHRLALDGREVELDLTAENFARLELLLTPYLKAGHRPDVTASPHTDLRGSRVYFAGLREFADAQNPPIDYKTSSPGKFSYSRDLRRRYAEHLAKEAG